jgi:hypothetical protein
MVGASAGARSGGRGEAGIGCGVESRVDSWVAGLDASSLSAGACGAADGSSEFPHNPQKRFVPGFSFPQRLQRKSTPSAIAYDMLGIRCTAGGAHQQKSSLARKRVSLENCAVSELTGG